MSVSCGHTECCWYVFIEVLTTGEVVESQNATWGDSAGAVKAWLLSGGVLQPYVCTSQLWETWQFGMKTVSSKENIN